MSVHACTCSALTSAFLLREINHKTEEAAGAWASRHPLLIQMPFLKFGMGCLSYLTSVILMTYENLRHRPGAQWISVVIGLMSTSTVVATAIALALDKPETPTPLGSPLSISNEASAPANAIAGPSEGNGMEMIDTQM
mmetsp:Transcript_100636/g.288371  ORF Transcript_100636/g.288371 Transcript_100636/m.288371 type:complete len:138 (-) Transcript_100636:217-630(-)